MIIGLIEFFLVIFVLSRLKKPFARLFADHPKALPVIYHTFLAVGMVCLIISALNGAAGFVGSKEVSYPLSALKTLAEFVDFLVPSNGWKFLWGAFFVILHLYFQFKKWHLEIPEYLIKQAEKEAEERPRVGSAANYLAIHTRRTGKLGEIKEWLLLCVLLRAKKRLLAIYLGIAEKIQADINELEKKTEDLEYAGFFKHNIPDVKAVVQTGIKEAKFGFEVNEEDFKIK